MGKKTTFHARSLARPDAEATPIEVEALGGGRYAVTLDGRRLEVDSLVLPHKAVSLLIDDDSYNIDFEERGDEVRVLVRGETFRFDVADERTLRLRAIGGGFEAQGTQVVTAPMPGKVVSVSVAVGDEVQEGQGLVVVEAMKMENELRAPRAGKVTEVHVKAGATVDNGAKLVVIE